MKTEWWMLPALATLTLLPSFPLGQKLLAQGSSLSTVSFVPLLQSRNTASEMANPAPTESTAFTKYCKRRKNFLWSTIHALPFLCTVHTYASHKKTHLEQVPFCCSYVWAWAWSSKRTGRWDTAGISFIKITQLLFTGSTDPLLGTFFTKSLCLCGYYIVGKF